MFLKKELYGFILVVPAIVITFVLIIYPVLYLIDMSLYEYEKLEKKSFIGFDNYRRVLTDPAFWKVFQNTIIYAVIVILGTFTIGLIEALLLFFGFTKSSKKTNNFIRTFFLLPSMLPYVVSILIFYTLYHPAYGAITYLFSLVTEPPHFLVDKNIALYACAFVNIWIDTPFVMLVLLAGLESIPAEIFEAAKIDGATFPKILIYIVFPLIKSALLVALLIRTMDSLMIFSEPFILTGGGPGLATETLTIRLFKVSLFFFEFGEGAAISVIHTVIVVFISLVYFKLFRGGMK
jgi:multiple sugar transport system permease protein